MAECLENENENGIQTLIDTADWHWCQQAGAHQTTPTFRLPSACQPAAAVACWLLGAGALRCGLRESQAEKHVVFGGVPVPLALLGLRGTPRPRPAGPRLPASLSHAPRAATPCQPSTPGKAWRRSGANLTRPPRTGAHRPARRERRGAPGRAGARPANFAAARTRRRHNRRGWRPHRRALGAQSWRDRHGTSAGHCSAAVVRS